MDGPREQLHAEPLGLKKLKLTPCREEMSCRRSGAEADVPQRPDTSAPTNIINAEGESLPGFRRFRDYGSRDAGDSLGRLARAIQA